MKRRNKFGYPRSPQEWTGRQASSGASIPGMHTPSTDCQTQSNALTLKTGRKEDPGSITPMTVITADKTPDIMRPHIWGDS